MHRLLPSSQWRARFHTPPPPELSALGTMLGEHVACRIKGELESIYAHTLSNANYVRKKADLEVEEVLEEGMVQFGMEKQHAMDEVEEVVHEKLEEFVEECANLVKYVEESVEKKANDIFDHTRERGVSSCCAMAFSSREPLWPWCLRVKVNVAQLRKYTLQILLGEVMA